MQSPNEQQKRLSSQAGFERAPDDRKIEQQHMQGKATDLKRFLNFE